MAVRRSSSILCAAIFALAALKVANLSFVGAKAATRASRVARSYDTGKVNIGAEEFASEAELPAPTLPAIEADEKQISSAIMNCIEEGCSVEAMMALDQQLAGDEKRITAAMADVQDLQKTSLNKDAGALVWYDNFLQRMGSLRAQVYAIKDHKDSDFIQQIMKATAVSFGGARENDYPKVGVSSYSA